MSGSLASGLFSPHRLILGAIFAGAIAAGWVMLPGQNERVAMLERDGHSREALTILESQYDAGDRRYGTLYQMQALYESEGNVAKARDVLQTMAGQRPRDAGLKRRLAQFYKATQDEAAYHDALRAQIELRYSETACRDLIAALRLKGDYTAEQAALQRCRQKGYRRAEDLSRLAELVAVDGDAAQAAALLRSIDDLKRLRTSQERYQLLTLLLEQDQPKEAERRALRWIRSSKDDQLAVGLIDILARSKFPASAIEVAKDAGEPGDPISLTVAERLIEQAQAGPARLYLNGWLDKSKIGDISTALRFVEAALAVQDPAAAMEGARKFGLDRLPAPVLAVLASALDRRGMSTDASAVRDASARRPEGGVSTPPAAAVAAAEPSEPGTEPPAPVAKSAWTNLEKPALRRTALPDPLEPWRKSLLTKMTDDAQRRVQSRTFGPPSPAVAAPHRTRHTSSFARGRGARTDNKVSGAKLLKKTEKVLQRTKINRDLKLKRRPLKDRGKPQGSKTEGQTVKPAKPSLLTGPVP
jgi:hypothetical protein